ncbi:hypothetical protein BOSE21B_90053 [Bosea sp. 21B]|nr:hypothetical protein BOSE21B_90053 [Bosea sp. 21B]
MERPSLSRAGRYGMAGASLAEPVVAGEHLAHAFDERGLGLPAGLAEEQAGIQRLVRRALEGSWRIGDLSLPAKRLDHGSGRLVDRHGGVGRAIQHRIVESRIGGEDRLDLVVNIEQVAHRVGLAPDRESRRAAAHLLHCPVDHAGHEMRPFGRLVILRAIDRRQEQVEIAKAVLRGVGLAADGQQLLGQAIASHAGMHRPRLELAFDDRLVAFRKRAGAAGRDQLGLGLMQPPGFEDVKMDAGVDRDQFTLNAVLDLPGALARDQMENPGGLRRFGENTLRNGWIAQITGISADRVKGQTTLAHVTREIATEEAVAAENDGQIILRI